MLRWLGALVLRERLGTYVLTIGTQVLRCLDIWVLGDSGAWVPGWLDGYVPRHLSAWVLGCSGTWVPGCLGAWVLGARVLVLGFLVAWVLGASW